MEPNLGGFPFIRPRENMWIVILGLDNDSDISIDEVETAITPILPDGVHVNTETSFIAWVHGEEEDDDGYELVIFLQLNGDRDDIAKFGRVVGTGTRLYLKLGDQSTMYNEDTDEDEECRESIAVSLRNFKPSKELRLEKDDFLAGGYTHSLRVKNFSERRFYRAIKAGEAACGIKVDASDEEHDQDDDDDDVKDLTTAFSGQFNIASSSSSTSTSLPQGVAVKPEPEGNAPVFFPTVRV